MRLVAAARREDLIAMLLKCMYKYIIFTESNFERSVDCQVSSTELSFSSKADVLDLIYSQTGPWKLCGKPEGFRILTRARS
jgi:hypothetical protein